jgi:hypothetical protein
MSIPEPHSSHSSEIAHVLCMDIVAYSTLPTAQQRRTLEELNRSVRDTREFICASEESGSSGSPPEMAWPWSFSATRKRLSAARWN